MRKVLFFLLITTSLFAQQNVNKESFQYQLTPVTDSTWNMDVINIAVSPQQIIRYTNMTKNDIDNFFFDKLIENYQIIASNGYKLVLEEARSLSSKNILASQLGFDYNQASVNRYKTSYAGRYNYLKTGGELKQVFIDTAIYVNNTVFDTALVTVSVPVYDTITTIVDSMVYDTIVTGSDTSINVSTIQVPTQEINVTYVDQEQQSITTTSVKEVLHEIVPLSPNMFKIKVSPGQYVTMYSSDKKSWIGIDEDTGFFYYIIKP